MVVEREFWWVVETVDELAIVMAASRADSLAEELVELMDIARVGQWG